MVWSFVILGVGVLYVLIAFIKVAMTRPKGVEMQRIQSLRPWLQVDRRGQPIAGGNTPVQRANTKSIAPSMIIFGVIGVVSLLFAAVTVAIEDFPMVVTVLALVVALSTLPAVPLIPGHVKNQWVIDAPDIFVYCDPQRVVHIVPHSSIIGYKVDFSYNEETRERSRKGALWIYYIDRQTGRRNKLVLSHIGFNINNIKYFLYASVAQGRFWDNRMRSASYNKRMRQVQWELDELDIGFRKPVGNKQQFYAMVPPDQYYGRW